MGAAEEETVAISGRVQITAPEPSTASTVFYTDKTGALFRDDPNQPELPEIARMTEAQ